MADLAEDTSKTADEQYEKDDCAAMVMARHREAVDAQTDWRKEAREDFEFAAGKQWSTEDANYLRENNRPVVAFNRIDPILDAVSGQEVSSRQEVKYFPRGIEDSSMAEDANLVAEWARDQCDAEDEESDAFRDTITCGMGWTETRMDYQTDLDGKIMIERRDPLKMFWDPASTKPNLADAKWVHYLDSISKADMKAMWPEKWEEIEGTISALGAEDDVQTTANTNDPERAYRDDQDISNVTGMAYKRGRFTVIQHQWCTLETVYKLATPEGVQELTAADYRKLEKAAKTRGLKLDGLKQKKQVWRQAFVCGKVTLEEGPVPGGKGATFRCITGKRDRARNSWYGLVRPMKDPQRFANKFFSQTLHMISTGAKGGVMAEKSAIPDMDTFKADYAKADSVVAVEDGALANGRVAPKFPMQVPAGIPQMMEFCISSIRDVSGVSLELLGSADRQQAGVLEYQRKQSGLTILANFFDSLRRYRKEQGRVLMGFIAEYLTDGRMIRIIGENGDPRMVPMIKERMSHDYDIVVDTAATSPNEKERVFAIMSQLLPSLEKLGAAPPPEVLDYAPLPTTLTQKWKESLINKPPIPPELQQQIEEGQKQIAQLTQENQKLQLAEQSKMMQAQLDGQMAAQKQAQEAELAQQKQAFEQQLAQKEFELEVWKAEQKSELDRQNLARQAQIEQFKLAAQAEAADQDRKIKDESHRAELARDAEKAFAPRIKADVDALSQNVSQLAKILKAPRKLVRDAEGRPVGAEIVLEEAAE